MLQTVIKCGFDPWAECLMFDFYTLAPSCTPNRPEQPWPLKQWLNDWQPSSSVMTTQETSWLNRRKAGVDCLASVAVSNVWGLKNFNRKPEVADSRKFTAPVQSSWPDIGTPAVWGDYVFGERETHFPWSSYRLCKRSWRQLPLWILYHIRAEKLRVLLKKLGSFRDLLC